MWHVLFSGLRLKFLFFREVKRFCFKDAYECVRACVCVYVQYVCVCVCLCVRASERARMLYVRLSVTLFCPFLKRSANALRACVHVHVYMSVYVACFVFRCEVKISVLS